jgi:hypothetical protein
MLSEHKPGPIDLNRERKVQIHLVMDINYIIRIFYQLERQDIDAPENQIKRDKAKFIVEIAIKEIER